MMKTEISSSAPSHVPAHGHLPGLDGLRGLAILAVMCHHLIPRNYPQGIPEGATGWVIKVFYRFFDIGWWGVDLFFVLSGFLITRILIEAKGSAHYFGHFYARRSLRIFPLYYGVLAVLFWILPWLAGNSLTGPWTRQAADNLLAISRANAPLQNWLWFYGTNIRTALEADGWVFGTLTHFWSLAVEEHFYLLWPVVVFCCSTRTLTKVCLGVAAGALLCRSALFVGGMTPAYIYLSSPCRFDSLALGGLVAALARICANGSTPDSSGFVARETKSRSDIWCLFRDPPAHGSIDLLRAASTRIFLRLLPVTAVVLLLCPRFGFFVVIFGHTLFAATFAAGLPGAAAVVRNSSLHRGGWLCFGPLQTLGKYSYGLYVLHPFVIGPLDRVLAGSFIQEWRGNSYALTAILRLVLGLSISLFVAWAVWHAFEKHFLKLKRFFPAGDRRLPLRSVGNPGVLAFVSRSK